jgi:hypothetical protein
MEKEMLGNMFKYEDGKLYKKHKQSETKWKCLNDNKPVNNGYNLCKVNKKLYLLHRLVYLFYNPEWDIHDTSLDNSIDHMNGDKLDNRIENLNCVNHFQNTQNINNRKGKEIKGYHFRKDGRPKPWIAYWNENGKQKSKYFKTKEEAKEYSEEMRKFHYYRPCLI